MLYWLLFLHRVGPHTTLSSLYFCLGLICVDWVTSLGCTYVTDMYEINDVHDCCPKLCYALNKSGDECRFEVTSSSAIRHVSSIGLVVVFVATMFGFASAPWWM